jgi:hypothetical protein
MNKRGFVTVNGRILDCNEYKSEVSDLRCEISFVLQDVLSKYGFILDNEHVSGYDCIRLRLKNHPLGLDADFFLKGPLIKM